MPVRAARRARKGRGDIRNSSTGVKAAAPLAYVAPTRQDRRASGELQEMTEGMKFNDLQVQEQMMAHFRVQKRRKTRRLEPKRENLIKTNHSSIVFEPITYLRYLD